MKKNMMAVFKPNKTSARLLLDYARVSLLPEDDEGGADERSEAYQRYLLLTDLFIKALSYAIINKVAFGLAMLLGALVLLWPSIAVVSEEFWADKDFLRSAVVQTTVTGLAALAFAVYSHYKKRQVFTENLMRRVLFSEGPLPETMDMVIRAMERIDTGFSFSQAVLKKGDSEEMPG